MAQEFVLKDKYNIDDLIAIIKVLRAPGGCPWDREQTHESIKKNFIEEVQSKGYKGTSSSVNKLFDKPSDQLNQ